MRSGTAPADTEESERSLEAIGEDDALRADVHHVNGMRFPARSGVLSTAVALHFRRRASEGYRPDTPSPVDSKDRPITPVPQPLPQPLPQPPPPPRDPPK